MAYATQLLEMHVWPTMLVMFDGPENGHFHDDNEPRHRSALAKRKCDDLDISRMEWPPNSPDLNAIEKMWQLLKCRICRGPDRPHIMSELRVAIEQACTEIAIWRSYVDNLHALTAVRAYRGYPTKYCFPD